MVVKTLEPDSQRSHFGALPLDSCLNPPTSTSLSVKGNS